MDTSKNFTQKLMKIAKSQTSTWIEFKVFRSVCDEILCYMELIIKKQDSSDPKIFWYKRFIQNSF